MATLAHCAFCFEALASHLEDRDSLTLAEVEKSWAEYSRTAGDVAEGDDGGASTSTNAASELTKRLPALRRLAASSSSSSSSSSSLGASSYSSSSSSTASLQQPSVAAAVAAAATASNAATPATSVSSLAPPPTPPHPPASPAPAESPLFVTWNTVSARHGTSLRGCIGTFEPQPLEEGLAAYALTSALQDTRFAPVAARELPTLEVAVTLLTDFEDRGGDALDWDLGTHGLRLGFHHHGRRYSATYLPDVAPEQGWTKEETVVSLMRKAGWQGRRDRWRDVDLTVVRYQGKRVSLEYAQYKRWRDWEDKRGDTVKV